MQKTHLEKENKMKIKRLLCLAIGLILLFSAFGMMACNPTDDDPTAPFELHAKDGVTSDTLHVKKVENLPDDFVMGMDASSVLSLEKGGVKFFDFDGTETDVFKILADNGINTIRVRVWNNPFDENGNGFGGGNCDIETAVEIGKRANKFGMNLMVDFHYSDFWADPSKQMAPREWQGMDLETKTNAVYEYTKTCLERLKAEKIRVSMVQVGNETNGAMCGEKTWWNITELMNAGSKAIRETYPKALVVLHFANPEKVSNYRDYAYKLNYYDVDYDVFASSYYPYWHGTLENLSTLLSEIAETYDKKVMVAETSYAYTAEDTDFFGNTIGEGSGVTKNYPFTIQGQTNCVVDVIETVANTTNGIGVCYWEGTWISAGGSSWEENSALWEQYGSGWATSYSAVYDPNDAGKYYGGSAVDNQTFFDKDGHVLESLKLFALAHTGNSVANKPDALEDVTIICDLNGTLSLPDTVNAIMLDDSKQAVNVVWNVTAADFEKMYNGGVAKYDVTGTADGMTAHCYISMVEFNFINNYSFEDDAANTAVPTGWSVISGNKPSSQLEMHVESGSNNSVTGNNHFHFWGANTNSVNFDLEQKVTGLTNSGTYKYSISISGSDGGATNIYAYVKINGEVVATKALSLNGYQNWDTALIENIQYNEGDEVVVGIHVECEGAGAGAWGKIDDALFNSVK